MEPSYSRSAPFRGRSQAFAVNESPSPQSPIPSAPNVRRVHRSLKKTLPYVVAAHACLSA